MSPEKNMDEKSQIYNEYLLEGLLNRSTFQWEKSPSLTIGGIIDQISQQEAESRISTLDQDSQLNVSDIINKIAPRARSWNYQGILNLYKNMEENSLEEFLNQVQQQGKDIKIAIDEYKSEEEIPAVLISTQWVVSTLSNEAKAALKKKSQAKKEKEKLKKEVLEEKIRQLKSIPDKDYGDQFNRLVCKRLDLMEITGQVEGKQNKLSFAESTIRQELENNLNDQKIMIYLQQKLAALKRVKLANLLERGFVLLSNTEKALSFAGLMFEISQRKTDQTWQEKKFEEIVTEGLRGKDINLISVLCTINDFDLNGNYTLIPDLITYRRNPKLEPVPLIIDEMAKVVDFLKFYDIRSRLTIYVADTDYTEIGQYGPITESNLKNIDTYFANLREYMSRNPNIEIRLISEVTSDNTLYNQVKKRVLENVTKFKDPNFEREWYQKFEDAFERVCESQTKRKLFPKNEIRTKSLNITRNIWAVNAAQGAVFGSFDPNTIILSTERRERDQNYTIDKTSRENFPPVVYILKAAETWNRKLTEKVD